MSEPLDHLPVNLDSKAMPTDRLRGWRMKFSIAAVLLMLAAILYWQFGDWLTLDALAQREVTLRRWQQEHPAGTIAMALLLYITVTGLSLPGAAVLSLTYAWYFGFWQGLVIVSFGSTAGATIAFLLSRYFFRDWAQAALARKLPSFKDAFEREGAYYLFTLRLVPAVPFFVINVLMGLTNLSVATFWWVSQIGMLPGTIAYVYAGSQVPSLKKIADDGVGAIMSPGLIIALVVLGILPWLIRRALMFCKRFSKLGADST